MENYEDFGYDGREEFVEWLDKKVCPGMSEGRRGVIRPNYERACDAGWIYKRELACWVAASRVKPNLDDYFARLSRYDIDNLIEGMLPTSKVSSHADRLAFMMILLSLEDYYVITEISETGDFMIDEAIITEYNKHNVELLMMLAKTGSMFEEGTMPADRSLVTGYTFFPKSDEPLS